MKLNILSAFLWALKWNLTSEALVSRINLPMAGGGPGEATEELYPLAGGSLLLENWNNKTALYNSRDIVINQFSSTW